MHTLVHTHTLTHTHKDTQMVNEAEELSLNFMQPVHNMHTNTHTHTQMANDVEGH